MSAFLVERDPSAYQRLSGIPSRFPDIQIRTYNDDFQRVFTMILKEIPAGAFTFFLIDPKGWRIPLRALEPLLSRRCSEVIFNFMFDFINRAASMKKPEVIAGLDELIPFGNWRSKLEEAEQKGSMTPRKRKEILIEAFSESLKQLGNYDYVAETTVLRPLKDRPLYCLFYATRNRTGIEVFRDCQITALREQSKIRAANKVTHPASSTGQGEFFKSLHDMAPDQLDSLLKDERVEAEKTLLELVPESPYFSIYEELWPQVLARHVVRRPDVNQIATRLRSEGRLLFPDWEKGKRVPQPRYRLQRA